MIELQAAGTGLDRDHVDGVADRVVQIAGDPRPLLGACQAPLALERGAEGLGGLPSAPLLGADVQRHRPQHAG